jgi:hypothetical protein
MLGLPTGRLRMAVAAALLVCGVVAGVLAVQSQTAAPVSQTIASADSAAGAEFYLKRGEASAGPAARPDGRHSGVRALRYSSSLADGARRRSTVDTMMSAAAAETRALGGRRLVPVWK